MNSDFLIVGGDGDLAFRKLYPGLYHLDLLQCLPADMRIICLAPSEASTDVFIQRVRAKLDTHTGEHQVSEEAWTRFNARLVYSQADATSTEALLNFKRRQFAEGGTK